MDLRNWLKKGTLREDEQPEAKENDEQKSVVDEVVTKKKKKKTKAHSEGEVSTTKVYTLIAFLIL